jgi:glycosyltransferase involved in cell wall biosynthesis
MRILFLVYHGFSEYSGISKKIHYQVKGLQENGHDVRLCYYGYDKNGHKCRFVDGMVIKDYGKGIMAGLFQRINLGCIYEYCLNERIEFVYARCFQNASPFLIHLFRKLKKLSIKAVTEIPTYPYDMEFVTFSKMERCQLKIDRLYRHRLSKEMSAIVTFSNEDFIFGQKTIRISNGVDFDSIPMLQFQPSNDGSVHLIGVAEVHLWHGYDRLMAGLGEYLKNMPHPRNVLFHVVGGVHPYRMKTDFVPIIEKYGIQDKVIFHGQLFGDELTKVFDLCQFAIGSLGRHRSGITVIKTLKNREYATRGIPFIYSEQDSDFDSQPYIVKAPADESPINIQHILDFLDHFTMKPEEIRKTVEHLTWKNQMQRVLDAVF